MSAATPSAGVTARATAARVSERHAGGGSASVRASCACRRFARVVFSSSLHPGPVLSFSELCASHLAVGYSGTAAIRDARQLANFVRLCAKVENVFFS